MKKIKRCLKEWNATLEALGKGKQTILIRNYKTNIQKFLLYPTISYTLNDEYLDSFQDKYLDFVRDNALPDKKDDKVLIKYYATVEEIIEKPISRIPSANNYIWTRDHVKDYITGKIAFVWMLRVYKLSVPYWAEPTPGALRFVNLKEEVSLDGIEPVLGDYEFEKVVAALK